MSEHLSPLVLDELAAGLCAPAGAAEHVSACAACAAKLERRKAEAAALLGRAQAVRRLDALLAVSAGARFEAQPEPAAVVSLAQRRMRAIASVTLPLAASLVLIFAVTLVQPRGGERLKGAATVALIDRSGESVQRAAPGDTVTLAVGGAGYSYAAVFAVDAAGAVAPLWPLGAEQAGSLAPGAQVRLADLETTPGDVRVVAFFSRTQRPLADFKAALEGAVSRAKAQGRAPLELQVPGGVADASAEVRLDVR